MKELVFLLEEASAKAMLESLLPRVLNSAIKFRCIPFEGKQDLEKQLIRKIRGYQNPEARFIVLRDQDSNPDCTLVKSRLLDLCQQSSKEAHCKVRIACRELETFYLADLQAVEQGLCMSGLSRHQATKKFRKPDELGSPSQELRTITKNRYEKVAGSRSIGKHLALDNTRSPSFQHLINSIHELSSQLLEIAP